MHLDLHGCTVADAIHLVRRCLQEGTRYARTRLSVITGYSTTTGSEVSTIKSELTKALETGAFGDLTSGHFWSRDGGQCVIALPIRGNVRRDRIRLRDVMPR